MLFLIRNSPTDPAGRGAFGATFFLSALACSTLVCSGLTGCAEPPAKTSDAGAGAGGGLTSGTELRFASAATLTLRPKEAAELSVRVTPALRQMVTFEILTSSDEFDGYLTANAARSDDAGNASVGLTAPSQPSTFMVRAFLDGETEARIAVSVSEAGFGSVAVTPQYAGTRKISQWTASARAGVSCEEIASYFVDGPLVISGARSLVLRDIPVGPSIALSIRGDELVSGCVDLSTLQAEQTADVTLPVNDRPIDLSNGTLSVTLGVDATTDEFAAHLEDAIAEAVLAYRGERDSDGPALLDWMGWQLDAASLSDFNSQRANLNYESLATSIVGESKFSTGLKMILADAADLIPGDNTLIGEWALHSTSADFTVLSASGVTAAKAGFSTLGELTISVETGDVLSFGGALEYRPVTWLSVLSEKSAQDNKTTFPTDALRELAECTALGAALSDASSDVVFDGCNEECAVSLCLEASDAIWQATKGNMAAHTLQIGAGGTAVLTAQAQPAKVVGSWVGRVDTGVSTSMKGQFSAIRK